ncbi:MAG: hypothetical protein H8E32_13870 [Nitrospinae bacterium]|nr:hypothetical protein [Nitrospinota bacterium]
MKNWGLSERKCIVCKELFFPKYKWVKDCWTCYQIRQAETEKSDDFIPDKWKEMILPLIQLCHPDKHKGSKLSNEVTRWLLEEREKIRDQIDKKTNND